MCRSSGAVLGMHEGLGSYLWHHMLAWQAANAKAGQRPVDVRAAEHQMLSSLSYSGPGLQVVSSTSLQLCGMKVCGFWNSLLYLGPLLTLPATGPLWLGQPVAALCACAATALSYAVRAVCCSGAPHAHQQLHRSPPTPQERLLLAGRNHPQHPATCLPPCP